MYTLKYTEIPLKHLEHVSAQFLHTHSMKPKVSVNGTPLNNRPPFSLRVGRLSAGPGKHHRSLITVHRSPIKDKKVMVAFVDSVILIQIEKNTFPLHV